jgi:hypothetical protein
MDSHVSGASRGGFDTRQKIEELRCKKASTAGDNNGFPAFSARLRNLVLPEKFKPLGITKYDTKRDPVQWLRCYALSIENAGGNNDTKYLSIENTGGNNNNNNGNQGRRSNNYSGPNRKRKPDNIVAAIQRPAK